VSTIRSEAGKIMLRCDMTRDCTAPISHIDCKGYIYCKPHGLDRKAYQRCRLLTPAEMKTLLRGEPIAQY
jgi:hypothetical protein